jgi:hypothetical protein
MQEEILKATQFSALALGPSIRDDKLTIKLELLDGLAFASHQSRPDSMVTVASRH